MADQSRSNYVTLAEAAELMSVSIKTVRRRIADGTLPAYRCGQRVIRVRGQRPPLSLPPYPIGQVVSRAE